MRIGLLAVGRRPPRWAADACTEYLKRLPAAWRVESRLIAPARGHAGNVTVARNDEGQRLLAACGPRDRIVALDEQGTGWSTLELAARLREWELGGRNITLWIGGADGLADVCLERADVCWSLSPLTLPHALVRVVVVEQLYRAWSINAGHPYHRA